MQKVLCLCFCIFKTALIQDLITPQKLDMILIVATWQQPEDYLHLNMLTAGGFTYLSKQRLTGKAVVV